MSTSKHQEELLDEALAESFPASDVPRVFEPESPAASDVVGHEEHGTAASCSWNEVGRGPPA